MKIEIPKFETQEEMFDYLAKNEKEHLHTKKGAYKVADCMIPMCNIISDKQQTSKATAEVGDTIKVRAIINTTNVMDAHGDVHIQGIWKKSLKENKFIKHLQEHSMSFKNIISDKNDLKAFTKEYDWKDLGIDKDGMTEALVFDSDVKSSRNAYMHEQYKDGNVDNHSVGMFYVNLKLAMNSKVEEHKKYKDEWDKHIDSIVNKAETEKKGMFWAVYEAKVREGSAVPLGSNYITPTLSRSKDTQSSDKEIAANKEALSGYTNFLNS